MKRSSKPSSDPNVAAWQTVREATEDSVLDTSAPPAREVAKRIAETVAEEQRILATGRNPHAVFLGRLGGRKGGPARAKKLSSERKSEIAKKAARARWKKRRRV